MHPTYFGSAIRLWARHYVSQPTKAVEIRPQPLRSIMHYGEHGHLCLATISHGALIPQDAILQMQYLINNAFVLVLVHY